MRIIFLGGPGTGKSTVGKRLAADLKWDWISSGEILRSSQEPWVQERLKTSELFDDEMVAGLVFSRLRGVQNALIDGFPRTLKQAQLMVEQGMMADMIVEMNLSEEEAAARMLLRGREQDTREIIAERWAGYMHEEAQIVAYLVGNGVKMVRIDAAGTPDEVYKRVVNEIVNNMKGNE